MPAAALNWWRCLHGRTPSLMFVHLVSFEKFGAYSNAPNDLLSVLYHTIRTASNYARQVGYTALCCHNTSFIDLGFPYRAPRGWAGLPTAPYAEDADFESRQSLYFHIFSYHRCGKREGVSKQRSKNASCGSAKPVARHESKARTGGKREMG